ncbi:MAG TPA: HBL/NHE enterotoxin family protein [Herpetosiphonaceae bacterium]
MLAPDVNDTIGQLTDIFNANASITTWVHALENTVLPPLLATPEWYDDLNATLAASQRSAQSWLTGTGPHLLADVSQSFIDYATLFRAVNTTMQPLLAEIAAAGANRPSADQQSDLRALVRQLASQAGVNQSRVGGLQSQLNAFRSQMLQDHETLATAITVAVAAEDQERATIEAAQEQLSLLMQKLATDSNKADSENISYGTAVFGMVVSLTFGLVISGGVLALGSFALGILNIGKAITSEIIYSDDVKKDLDKIADLLGTLAADKQQLAMLQGLVNTLQQLNDENTQALLTFANLGGIWDRIADRLDGLLVTLDQPQIDISRIPDLQGMAASTGAWQQLETFADSVQTLHLQIPPAIALPMVTTSALVAA